MIDLLVYRETVLRGRRVWLDFRSNPRGGNFDISLLSPEAREYLERTGVADLPASAAPVQRLQRLNQASYDFYLERGPRVDLETEMLEIAVCAQHNNGGLEVDAWWRSPLSGLYPVGEAAGAHGIYRPGGAALNSGQVGATRAAQWIVNRGPASAPDADQFAAAAGPVVSAALRLVDDAHSRFTAGSPDNTAEALTQASSLMSEKAGLVRSAASVAEALAASEERLANYDQVMAIDATSRRSIDRLFLVRDIVTTQYVYLTAMADYLDHGGHSRGSVLYTEPAGELPVWQDADGNRIDLGLDETFRFVRDDGSLDDVTQIVTVTAPSDDALPPVDCAWRPVRPLPRPDEPFEVVWRAFLNDSNVH